jgi:hypothetical protein
VSHPGKTFSRKLTDDEANDPSYPLLLHATVNNRLDIVRFLVDNGYADVNRTKAKNFYEHAALMFAASDGHLSIAQYLIDAGADVNDRSRHSYPFPRTVLMCAAANDHSELFILLHRSGARIVDRLLKVAVESKSESIRRSLLNECLATPDQLELQAASSPLRSSRAEISQNRITSLRICLEYRQRTGQRKIAPPALEIYDYQEECQTVDELERIVHDHERMIVELLLIEERLQLSEQQSSRIQLLEEYSEMLVERKRFDTCLNLCHHHFDLTERHEDGPSLYLFIWQSCAILSSDHRLPIDGFLRVANLISRPSYKKNTERPLNNALFMVVLATKVTFPIHQQLF